MNRKIAILTAGTGPQAEPIIRSYVLAAQKYYQIFTTKRVYSEYEEMFKDTKVQRVSVFSPTWESIKKAGLLVAFAERNNQIGKYIFRQYSFAATIIVHMRYRPSSIYPGLVLFDASEYCEVIKSSIHDPYTRCRRHHRKMEECLLVYGLTGLT